MLPDRLRRLVQLLARLPGVGEKTAHRFALMFVQDPDFARDLANELAALPAWVGTCERCHGIAEVDPSGAFVCSICRDSRRDDQLLCIVARVQDQLSIERSGAMRGRYFILGSLLSPLEGIGPDDLPLEEIKRRCADLGVKEIIVATPPSVDGEATAFLLASELGKQGLVISRIASGVPHGGDLEFADQVTLGRAIVGRRGIDVSR
ncbi:MAG TPA: recombination mediator RecR [Polyangiaceae bacterium]|jgi:recombination protein RecR|nr:recombination mediator RecR [Polyangiaceae bacterium]